MGDIDGMDAVRNMTGGCERLPVIAFPYGDSGADFSIRGCAHLKAAVHVASGLDFDSGDIFTVKVFKAGGGAVCHIAYIAGQFIPVVAVLRDHRAVSFVVLKVGITVKEAAGDISVIEDAAC